MKFEKGDKVYHRNRKQYGIVLNYDNCFDDEVWIEFCREEPYDTWFETARVTESWCDKVEDIT